MKDIPHPSTSLVHLCEQVWNECYPDRRPWNQIGQEAQEEWLRVFSAYEAAKGDAAPTAPNPSTFQASLIVECAAFEQWWEVYFTRRGRGGLMKGWGHPSKDGWHEGCRCNEYCYGDAQDIFEAWLASKSNAVSSPASPNTKPSSEILMWRAWTRALDAFDDGCFREACWHLRVAVSRWLKGRHTNANGAPST